MIKSKLLLLFIIFFSVNLNAENLFWMQDTTLVSDTLQADTTAIASDSLKVIPTGDTLKPLIYQGLTADEIVKSKLTRERILRTDHRYTEDLFNKLPFGYLTNFGTVGKPSEVMLYGMGFSNISFLQNGISYNNKYQNALDLNLVQSESIDSIVVPSLASGFFYNALNNPVTVNFITRLEVDPRPYSRIKFYQGPDNEGMFDGLFSAYAFKRVNVSFQITNQSVDSRYESSSLSNWLFNTRIRYLFNNNINFIIGFDFSKINMDLNGGVNVSATPELLYDNILAEVNYDNRYHKNSRYNYFAKTILKFDSLSYTDVTFYFRDELDEFRQNEHESNPDLQSISNNNAYKNYGLLINQSFTESIYTLELLGRFEKSDYSVDRNPELNSINSFAAGANLSAAFLKGKFIPSLFIKNSDVNGNNLFGFGAQNQFNINEYFSLSAGYSNYKRIYDTSLRTGDVEILEASLRSKSSFGNLDLSYFSITQTNYAFAAADTVNILFAEPYFQNYLFGNYERSGLNLKTELKIWKLLLSSNSTFYFSESNLAGPSIPELTSFGGIYYVDTLFNNNLNLKTGINYRYYSERNFSLYDFEKMERSNFDINGNLLVGYNQKSLTNIAYQFDFFLSATIQERATIFFVFENIMNAQYYVVPYYPVQSSGLRFGVTWEFLD